MCPARIKRSFLTNITYHGIQHRLHRARRLVSGLDSAKRLPCLFSPSQKDSGAENSRYHAPVSTLL